MLCDLCKKNPANFHYTKIINGKVEEIHLCSQCSKEKEELNSDLSIHNLLTGLIDSIQGDNIKKEEEELYCDKCKLTYRQFKSIGKLGCDKCYENFKLKLDPLIKGIQASSHHLGKIPNRASKTLKLEREILKEKAYIEKLVEKEEFEQAAIVRDRIKELEQELKEGGLDD